MPWKYSSMLSSRSFIMYLLHFYFLYSFTFYFYFCDVSQLFSLMIVHMDWPCTYPYTSDQTQFIVKVYSLPMFRSETCH